MTVSNVDELLKKYGNDPGRYQIFVLVLLWIAMCSLALNNISNVFITTVYPHHCKIEKKLDQNLSIPKNENGEYESCLMYVNGTNNTIEVAECTNGWQFNPPGDEWTIVQEWDLVCQKYYFPTLATSIYFAGVTVGAAAFGYLADKYGRKPIIIVSIIANVIITIAITFSYSYIMFVIMRFFQGFFLQGGFNGAYILSVEMFQPARRTMVAVVAQSLWPVMLSLLAGLYYAFNSWKTVHLIINVPFFLTIAYIWLIPESIRWLLAVGNIQKAKSEINRICKFNKLPLSAHFSDDVRSVVQEINKNKKKENQKYGLYDLVRRKKMRIISILSFYYYFVAMFCYYAISFAMVGFKVNLYVSFAITGLIELAVILIMYIVLQRIGRRVATQFFTGFSSFVCFIVVILQLTLPEDGASEMGVTIAAAIGRASLAGYFSVMPIYSNELSPTVLRNLLCGIANFWGRIGAIIAPQVMLLEIYVWRPLPFLICAILCCVAAIFTHLLPETKNKPLPDIPEEVDVLWLDPSESLSLKTHNRDEFEKVALNN